MIENKKREKVKKGGKDKSKSLEAVSIYNG